MNRKDGSIKASDYATDHTLPFPDSDFSPTLQRVLKRKLESGELESVDKDEFFKVLGRAAKDQDESSGEEQ